MKTEFPKEPGWYWFYGYTSSLAKRMGDKKRVSMVKVSLAGMKPKQNLMYIADGQFMYPAEGGEGEFVRAEVPQFVSMEEESARPTDKTSDQPGN